MTRLFMKNIWSIRKPARYLVYRAGFDFIMNIFTDEIVYILFFFPL